MIPELAAISGSSSVIRIPNQLDVPVTPRMLRLIDSPPMQRLRQISQLGLVAGVYPGANHSRFEHSLGVFRNGLLVLSHLSSQPEFRESMNVEQLEALIIASLLHDIGHWPWCHPIEDIGLATVPSHESIAAKTIAESGVAELIEQNFACDVESVIRLIANQPTIQSEKLAASILSGPIDIDKMDYLYRDSLHCGVPYGLNFDSSRLIHSICVNERGDGIAITEKGKTAAEMMVFARYVMFSEVYWHHAVRSATAMIQRLFFELDQQAPLDSNSNLFRLDDSSLVAELLSIESGVSARLARMLFGPKRLLFKRLVEFDATVQPKLHQELAHQPYEQLVSFANELAQRLSSPLSQPIEAAEILIDAPPAGLEVQFKVDVRNRGEWTRLESLSAVVEVLARSQFDSIVKRVRVFVHPRLQNSLDSADVIGQLSECAGV